MAIRIGVIADDFTGATDIAGFLVSGGLRTAQINGVPTQTLPDVDAVVISLKSRSIPAEAAVEQSLEALKALRRANAEQIFFKYCSTFDSTADGNIGPVTDALMAALGADITVVCPGLPVNGRTVYHGHLFVNGIPLDESGMRNHPVTPMTDSNLVRLMDAQSDGRAAVVPFPVVDAGPQAIARAIDQLREEGVKYAVTDTLTEQHLRDIGEAVRGFAVVTGGSGLGGGIARALTDDGESAAVAWPGVRGRAIVLSGSASQMTNEQVAAYREVAPSLEVDVGSLLDDRAAYREHVLSWAEAQPHDPAPMVFATAPPDKVQQLQDRYGASQVSEAIEGMFGWLAAQLRDRGVKRFIVAGGETSGAVTTALGVDGFHIGPQIAAGVPWVQSLDRSIELALKSGNFGDRDFFAKAQNWEVQG